MSEPVDEKTEEAVKEAARLMVTACSKLIVEPGPEEARLVREYAKRLAAMIMPSREPLEQIRMPDGTMTCERHEPVTFTVAPFDGYLWCPNCLSLHDRDGKNYFGKLKFDEDGGLLFQPIVPLNYISMTVTLPEGVEITCVDPGIGPVEEDS